MQLGGWGNQSLVLYVLWLTGLDEQTPLQLCLESWRYMLSMRHVSDLCFRWPENNNLLKNLICSTYPSFWYAGWVTIQSHRVPLTILDILISTLSCLSVMLQVTSAQNKMTVSEFNKLSEKCYMIFNLGSHYWCSVFNLLWESTFVSGHKFNTSLMWYSIASL